MYWSREGQQPFRDLSRNTTTYCTVTENYCIKPEPWVQSPSSHWLMPWLLPMACPLPGLVFYAISTKMQEPAANSKKITNKKNKNGRCIMSINRSMCSSFFLTDFSYFLAAVLWIFYISDDKGMAGNGALRLSLWWPQESKSFTQEIPLLMMNLILRTSLWIQMEAFTHQQNTGKRKNYHYEQTSKIQPAILLPKMI